VDTIILLLWDFVLLDAAVVLLENSLSHDQLKLHISCVGGRDVRRRHTTQDSKLNGFSFTSRIYRKPSSNLSFSCFRFPKEEGEKKSFV
jgi:hypothetical protein